MNITKQIKQSIEQEKLLSLGDNVVVGVSGGMDSVALLHILVNLQYDLGIHLHAAHFNHNLRANSTKDQEFVATLAKNLNVPFSAGQWKSKIKKGSIEEKAREARFKFLMETAKKQKTKLIILAHHQDDLAETVLMRILRGSGLQGIRSILPKRDIDSFTFIRPLLSITKNDLKEYMIQNNLRYRTDPSNKQTEYLRNKIRLKLLPKLQKEYNPNISETLSHLSNNASLDYDYLQHQAQKAFHKSTKMTKKNQITINAKLFAKYHPAIKRMIIRIGIQTLNGNTNKLIFNNIKEIENLLTRKPVNTIVNLPHQISLRKGRETLILSKR